MHEVMVAENILASILESAKDQPGRAVLAVMSCGQINAVNDEAMQFALDAACTGTVCEGIRLKIRHLPMGAVCRVCGSEFAFDLYSPVCPECGKSDFAIGDDPPLLLEEVEFE